MCERIDAFLADARRGDGGALLLRGPPGIGKSSLLAYASSSADGMRLLSATGVESESRIPFAGLAALLHPLLSRLSALAPDRRAALARALALQPASADRFAVGLATLELLSLVADESPVCAIVDDAHWLDSDSLDALRFTARRLTSDPVALLIAVRDGEEADVAVAGVEQVDVGGLDARAGETLLEDVLRGPIPSSIARKLVEATGGNPLALVELAALSDRTRLTDLAGLERPLPIGPQISRAHSRRIEALPFETQRALSCAAVIGSPEMAEVAGVLRRLGLETSALSEAERAGLIDIEEGELHFAHPLLRAAAYHALPGPERRIAHLAVAETIGEAGSSIRRAWHLATAVAQADEKVASLLEAAGAESRARGAPAAAGAALRKAAHLSPDTEDRVRRLMEGAGDFHVAGRVEEGVAMLAEAAERTTDRLARSDIEHLRVRLTLLSSPCTRTRDGLVAQAESIAGLDGRRAAALLLDASMLSVMAGQPHRALELARLARPAAGRQHPEALQLRADYCLGVGLVLCGQGPAAEPLLDRAEALTWPGDVVADGYHAVAASQLNSWRERHGEARAQLERLVERARRESILTLLPYALAGVAEAAFALGEWNLALASAAESVELAEEVGQLTELAHSLARLAHVEAGLGREAACREHLERASQLARELEIGSIRTLAGTTRGLLELGLGRPREAAGVLRDTGRFSLANGLMEPGVSMWAGDLAEACARADALDEAQAALSVLQDQAAGNRRSAALAVVARLRGILAAPDDYAAHFAAALEWHDRMPLPFEVARTRLCFGERLRRDRHRIEARDQLHLAHETFEQLGASPWVHRTRVELQAAGEAVTPGTPQTAELTPQELQVALLVSEGATNREVAASLFLSPKTVEVHLTHTYRKLGVRSRTELARVLDRTRPERY